MENKKLTQEELQQIETVKQKSQAVVQELGQIELLKLEKKILMVQDVCLFVP